MTFDKCLQSCNHDHNQTTLSSNSQIPCATLKSVPSTYLWLLVTDHQSLVLPFLECHIYEVKQYAAFSNCLLSFNIICFKKIYQRSCMLSSWFLFFPGSFSENEYTKICSFIYYLMCIWAVFSFGPLRIKLL